MEGTPISQIVFPTIYMASRGRRNAVIDLFNASLHELENIELMNPVMTQRTDIESAHPRACAEFINTLEEVNVTQEMVSEGLECAICMEAFKANEKCVKLPCTDHPHYFHYGHEGSECSGIKPWLQRNNTCPVCRTEFPTENVIGNEGDILEERIIEIPPSLIPTNNTTLTPDQIEGLQNNTNMTNIIQYNQVTNMIENGIMNAFVNGIRRERMRVRNEEAEIQRAIELSLLDNVSR
tara:strand:+ start:222 stop:932 length:711 start_codon:yes stop_codon:yes gene_type:complete